MNFHNEILIDESGAVTIDFVALVAGVLLTLTATIYAIFNTGVADLVRGMNLALTEGAGSTVAGQIPNQNSSARTDAIAAAGLIGQQSGPGNAVRRGNQNCSATAKSNAAVTSACRGG